MTLRGKLSQDDEAKASGHVVVKKRFVTVLISVGLLAGLASCSESSDEVAELRAELDATRADLAELTSMKDGFPEKKEQSDKAEVTNKTSTKSFGNGTWEVGVDIEAGTYASSADGLGCYWERLSGFEGTLSEILANGVPNEGPVIVTILPTDKGFRSQLCAEWVKRDS